MIFWLLVFGGRAGFEPALNKTGIMLQKIERDDSRQHREEKPKSPRLPEMESPGGGEKHHRRDDLKPDEAGNSLLCEFLHDLRKLNSNNTIDSRPYPGKVSHRMAGTSTNAKNLTRFRCDAQDSPRTSRIAPARALC
jgi:hypothetical protein